VGREVSYNDAVKLLGGDAAKIVKLVDTLMGVGLLALVGPLRDLLGWFDAKAELSRITEALIAGLAEKRSKLTRYERTERLQAAHAALALTAFFEAMAEADLPFPYRDLELTADEQRSLGSVTKRALAGSWRMPVPGPAESHDEFRSRLLAYYRLLAPRVDGFAVELAVWERLSPANQARAAAVMAAVPQAATARFDSLLGRLASDFPEVAFWAGMREHTAAHARLGEVTTGLAELRDILDKIAEGREPDDRRRSLALRYAAALRRPIAESGEVPAGLRVPLLGEAFLPQLFRVAEVDADAELSSEDWWERCPVRDDLLAFLTGHCTSDAATAAPLLILGQPGSGKSVLAKILAGQLPPTDFLPVLVPLRAVQAAAEIQDQIEQAIRADTGERVDWPALSRSAGDALPVVILDGFDELLQATGVSQTDYLGKVAAFQRREAEMRRPVAVIVTSRTSVADRAAAPEESVAVRLEPFDRDRVAAWLGVWNSVNADRFARGPEQPLDLETVMRYPALAEQPLLLLMLAFYDAEGNALRGAGDLRADELYERLLKRFARREVSKLGDGLPHGERARRVEAELRKLSVVAFAMFNRGGQWITEAELETDLRALRGLTGPVAGPALRTDLRAPLRDAELALGSFFFVHRARASRDGIALETYEFLHATFGEYLVARLVHGVVRSLIARERASTFPSGTAVDDDLLSALLSFAPLAGRRQTVDFLRGLVGVLPADERGEWGELLRRLFRASTMPRPPRAFEDYCPKPQSVPYRLAAFTSNLLVLALCAEDTTATQLFDDSGLSGLRALDAWRGTCLLWRSRPDASGWLALMSSLVRLERDRDGERIDVSLSLNDGFGGATPLVDLSWNLREDSVGNNRVRGQWKGLETARQQAHFTCDFTSDIQQHALDPLVAAGAEAAGAEIFDAHGLGFGSSLNLLLRLVTAATLPVADRMSLYRAAALLVDPFDVFAAHLLRQVAADQELTPEFVAGILRELIHVDIEGVVRTEFVGCALAHLDPHQHPAGSLELAVVLQNGMHPDRETWTEADLEAAIRLSELGLGKNSIPGSDAEVLLARYAAKRPDFVHRLRPLIIADEGWDDDGMD
jgi:energy-coupling factor transporter ATP-binding protein EcfA2